MGKKRKERVNKGKRGEEMGKKCKDNGKKR